MHVSCTDALECTKEYAHQRKAFGEPLAANQYLQCTYAELAAEVDLLRQYCYALADAVIAGENTTRMATIAKLKAGRLVREVGDWCMQVHGAIGYMEETWTARLCATTGCCPLAAALTKSCCGCCRPWMDSRARRK